jgi:hypothetical protein
MQHSPVYLYPNKIEVYTSSMDSAVGGFRKVYQRNLKIYRSVDNKIDIQVRNCDQKAISVLGENIVFSLTASDTQELLLEKDATFTDDSSEQRGRVAVTISENDLLSLEPGYYEFSVRSETRSYFDDGNYVVTSSKILYVDSQFGARGVIEIAGDINGRLQSSVQVREFSRYLDDDGKSYYISSIINAEPKTTSPLDLHTFQFYTTEYYGEVVIQASLEEAADPLIWVDVPDSAFLNGGNNFDPEAETYKNVIGKWNWFRIKHSPSRFSKLATFVIAQTILNSYTVSIREGGSGYSIGDEIRILGGRLGGETTTNDLIITVTDVDGTGRITSISWIGNSYSGVKTFVLPDEESDLGTVDKVLYRQ